MLSRTHVNNEFYSKYQSVTVFAENISKISQKSLMKEGFIFSWFNYFYYKVYKDEFVT